MRSVCYSESSGCSAMKKHKSDHYQGVFDLNDDCPIYSDDIGPPLQAIALKTSASNATDSHGNNSNEDLTEDSACNDIEVDTDIENTHSSIVDSDNYTHIVCDDESVSIL